MEAIFDSHTLGLSPLVYWVDRGETIRAISLDPSTEPFAFKGPARDIWLLLAEKMTYQDLIAELELEWEPFGEAEVEEVKLFISKLMEAGYVTKCDE